MDIDYARRWLGYSWINFSRYFSLNPPYVYRVPPPKLVSHSQWVSYLSREFNKEGMKVLEVGARVVTGSCFRPYFARAQYTGFDFYTDENVDIVGDAHRLSSYFPAEEKFDLIFSTAVFEHLHMPWIVAQEMQKLLKVGGFVFVETVFSFSAHERPWNFFQFSDMGLRVLFNKSLGFETLDSGMSNPMNGYFDKKADKYLRYSPVGELYCHSGILAKLTRDVRHFDWSVCKIDDIIDPSLYPEPKQTSRSTDADIVASTRKWEAAQRDHRVSFFLMRNGIPFLASIEEKKWIRRLAKMKFDEEFYLDLSPDVRGMGMEARTHFLRYGSREGRKYRFGA